MSPLLATANALSRNLAEAGIDWLLQSTLLLLAGLAVVRLARGRGAAVQSTILRVVLVAVLLCPLVSMGLGALDAPRMAIRLPQAPPQEPPEHTSATTQALHISAEPTPGPAAHVQQPAGPPSALPVQADRRVSGDASAMGAAQLQASSPARTVAILTTIFAALWALVAAALLARLCQASAHVRRLRVTATPAPQDVVTRCRDAAARMGICPPEVRVSAQVTSPCLAGIRRPVILLPNADALTASDEVLVHELAHLKRRDGFWNLLASLACAVLWFQPLVWALRRRLVDTADDVADDYVVHHGLDRRDYARRLTDIAERFQACTAEAVAGVGVVAFTSSLGRRVQRILDSTRRLSTRITIRTLVHVLILSFFGVVLVSLIDVERQGTGGGYNPADWRVTLDNGVTVELVGVRYAKGTEKDPWWRPDGTVVTEPATCFIYGKPDPNMPAGEAFEFAYHITYPNVEDIDRLGHQVVAGWWKPKVYGAYGSGLLASDGVSQDRSCKVHMPDPADEAKVKIGVGIASPTIRTKPALARLSWATFDDVQLKPNGNAQPALPSPQLTAHKYWKRGDPFRIRMVVDEMEWRPVGDRQPRPELLINGKYYKVGSNTEGPIQTRPYKRHSGWLLPRAFTDPPDLPPGTYRLTAVWKDVEATRGAEGGDGLAETAKLDELRSNEIEFEVVDEYPEGYFAPVYEEGWDTILAERVVVGCTDAEDEEGRPRLRLDVAPLPFAVLFTVYAEERQSDVREKVGAIALPTNIQGFDNRWFRPEALTRDKARDQEWRLVFEPNWEAALYEPPLRHYYGRKFVTDWVRFQPAKEWGVTHALNMPLDALPQVGEEIVAILSPTTFKQQLVLDLHTGRMAHRSMSDVYVEWVRMAGDRFKDTSGFSAHGIRTWCGPVKQLPPEAFEERVVDGRRTTVATERLEPALDLWTADSVDDLPPSPGLSGADPYHLDTGAAWAPLEAAEGLPEWPAPFATAFETVYGDIGVLQYIRTHEQRVVVRYKFLQYAPKRKVYLPSFKSAGNIHQTLDLPSGTLVPINGVTNDLTKGDLFFNDEENPAPWCLRGGEMRLRDGDAFVPIGYLPMEPYRVRGYPMPKLPCAFQLTCADGAAYEVRVLSLLNDNQGVAAEYWPVELEENTQ